MNKPDDDAPAADVARLIWSSSSYSHVGMVRKVNEDALLEQGRLDGGGLWAVADGMGGHEAGDVASRMIVDALAEIAAAADLNDLIEQTRAALLTANRRIQDRAERDYQRRTIGSTAVVMVLSGGRGACLWAGDSRLYRLRHNRLEQISRDHSHVQEMLERGLISAAEAEHHPMSNVITRAVGSNPHLDVDVLTFDAQPGDVYLLCSDGLTKAVSHYDIEQLLSTSQTRHTVNALINAALRRHADDNVTAVVVAVGRDDDGPGAETLPIDDQNVSS